MSFGMLECPYQIDKNARRGRAESQPSSSQEDLYGWRPTEKLLHRTHFLMGERRTNVKSLIRKKNFNSNHKKFREMGHLHWRNYIMLLLKKLKSKLDCLFFFLVAGSYKMPVYYTQYAFCLCSKMSCILPIETIAWPAEHNEVVRDKKMLLFRFLKLADSSAEMYTIYLWYH